MVNDDGNKSALKESNGQGATGQRIVPTKRVVHTDTIRDSKRIRTAASTQVEIVRGPLSQDKRSQDDAENHATEFIKKEIEVIDIDADATDNEMPVDQEEGLSQAPIVAANGCQQDDEYFPTTNFDEDQERSDVPNNGKGLPILFSVPSECNNHTIHLIEELPQGTRKELALRHERASKANRSRAVSYKTILKNPEKYMEKHFCVFGLLLRDTHQMNRGKLIHPDTFVCGGTHRVSADDKCILKSQPCVHIIEYKGAHALCIVPLPEGLRDEKTWTDLGYWVWEETQ